MTEAAASAGTLQTGPLTPKALDELLERVSGVRAVAYLLASDGLSERCLFFPVGGLRLSSVGARKARSVADVLLARTDLRPEVRRAIEDVKKKHQAAVEEAVARHKKGDAGTLDVEQAPPVRGSELEEVTEKHGLRQVYLAAAAAVARDELFDLIVWDGAEYEFRDSNPPPRIFDAEVDAVKVSLGVKDLLAEARSAIAEWQKLQVKLGQPSRSLVTRKEARASGREGVEAAVLGAVPVGAAPTINDVILVARKAGHDAVTTCRVISALSDRGVLAVDVKPPPPTPQERSRRALSDMDRIEKAMALMIQELQARRRLAGLCKETGDIPRAVENLRYVGDALAAQGRHDEAIGAMREVLDLNPGAFDARERIAGLLEALGRTGEAVKEWLAVAREFGKLNLWNRAIQGLRRAVRLDGRDVDMRRRLAQLLEQRGKKEEAARELEELARVYDGLGQEEAALACFADLARLAPDHPEAKKRLAASMKKGAKWAAPIVGSVVVALALVVAGGWVWRRHEALVAWQAARTKALELARHDRWDEARREVELVTAQHDLDPVRVQTVRDAIDHLQDDVGRVVFVAAEAGEKAGEVVPAREEYRKLARAHAGRPWGGKAEERLAKLREQEVDAEAKAKTLAELVDAGRTKEALEVGRALVAAYPWTEAAAKAAVPLEVKTTPPGAQVSVDGEAHPSPTPCVVTRPIQRPWSVAVTLAGHSPWTATLDVAKALEVRTPLEVALFRAPRWRVDAQAPLPLAPVPLTDGGLVVAGDDPRIYRLTLDGSVSWVRPLPPFTAAAGRPVSTPGMVVVVDSNGRAMGLDPRTGAVRWERALELPGAAAAGRLGELVLVASEERAVALDPVTGKPEWSADLGARLVAPLQVVAPEQALGAADDGRLLALTAAGKVEVRADLKARLTAPPLAVQGGWIVINEEGEVRSVGGPAGWTRKLPAPTGRPPALGDGLVYVAAGTHLVALDLKDGAVKWDKDLGATLGAPTASTGRVYVGGADGHVRALLAGSGDVRWTARAEGEVTAAPVVQRGLVYVVSAGFGVYAVPE